MPASPKPQLSTAISADMPRSAKIVGSRASDSIFKTVAPSKAKMGMGALHACRKISRFVTEIDGANSHDRATLRPPAMISIYSNRISHCANVAFIMSAALRSRRKSFQRAHIIKYAHIDLTTLYISAYLSEI